jgi:hypothetical protein
MERTCVACGNPLAGGVATREHVLAQWLGECVKLPDVSFNLYRHHEDGNHDQLLRSHGLNNLATKRVCQGCNNGWMSRLEDRAKPLLLDLMTVRRRVTDLRVEERTIIGAWAAKTGFLLTSIQTAPFDVPWQLLQELGHHEGAGPEGCYVLAAQLASLPNGFLYACPTDVDSSGATVQVRVGITINQLHFVILIPADARPRVLRAPGCYTPLWPLDLDVLTSHPPTVPVVGERDLINALTNAVEGGVLQRRVRPTFERVPSM